MVITELLRQQKDMYDNKKHTTPGRIVSISQPHVRPIVRGKAGKSVEFGAKLNLSLVDGLLFTDHLDWENFNESKDLIEQIEKYKTRFGFYPKNIYADKIYWNSKNREFIKDLGIKMYGGVPLGRPGKTAEALAILLFVFNLTRLWGNNFLSLFFKNIKGEKFVTKTLNIAKLRIEYWRSSNSLTPDQQIRIVA